jgi:hypothetical protein
MKICVSAPDSKLANLAILRIAQYHINKGDTVKWYEPLFDTDADKLYISKIFTFTPLVDYTPNCEIIKGGTGYDVKSVLPLEIEAITDIRQAYLTLYTTIDYSLIFTTRGCVRKCSFCVVPQKEGLMHDVNITELNPNGRYIKVFDNSFFTSKSWRKRLDYLKALKQPLDFMQGIDIRLLTSEQAEALGDCNIKSIHIAWDNLKEEDQVFKGVERLAKYVSPNKLTCYVLVGFEQPEIIESDIYRVMKLHKYKITPFAMGYIDFGNPLQERTESVRHFQRWVNKHIFKTVRFDDYKKKSITVTPQEGKEKE